MSTGSTEPHTFGIFLVDKQVVSCPKSLNIVVVIRFGISRTYDDVMNCVVHELEHDPYVIFLQMYFQVCEQEYNGYIEY